jgi:hypothetical protein
VLKRNNNSGAFNPHVDTGQSLGFGDEAALPATGTIKSSAAFSVVANNATVSLSTNNGSGLQLASSTSGNATLFGATPSGEVLLSGASVRVQNTGVGGSFFVDKSVVVPAIAGTGSSVTVGTGGEFFCSGTTPATPKFKDASGAWALGYACVSVNTTTPSASAATTNLSCGGSFNVPADSARVGTLYRLHGQYVYAHAAATTPTLTFEVLIAGGVVESVVLTPVAVATTYTGWFTALIRYQGIGAGGSAMVTWTQNNDYESGVDQLTSSPNTILDSVNTTAIHAIELRVRMTTGVASNTLTVTQGFIERLN